MSKSKEPTTQLTLAARIYSLHVFAPTLHTLILTDFDLAILPQKSGHLSLIYVLLGNNASTISPRIIQTVEMATCMEAELDEKLPRYAYPVRVRLRVRLLVSTVHGSK